MTAAAAVSLWQGCGGVSSSQPARLTVVCTALPLYGFAQEVMSGVPGISLELLSTPTAGCEHDLTLTTGDLKRVTRANLVITHAASVDTVLARGAAKGAAVLNTAACGRSEHAEHAGHGHAHESSDCEHHHDTGIAHGWMSPTVAREIVRAIATELGRVDAGNADRYARNAGNVAARLEQVGREVEAIRTDVAGRRVAMPVEVFDLLARDLGLVVGVKLGLHEADSFSAGSLAGMIRALRHGDVAALRA